MFRLLKEVYLLSLSLEVMLWYVKQLMFPLLLLKEQLAGQLFTHVDQCLNCRPLISLTMNFRKSLVNCCSKRIHGSSILCNELLNNSKVVFDIRDRNTIAPESVSVIDVACYLVFYSTVNTFIFIFWQSSILPIRWPIINAKLLWLVTVNISALTMVAVTTPCRTSCCYYIIYALYLHCFNSLHCLYCLHCLVKR